MLLGNKIRSLRDEQGILQRQVAAYLEIDTPMFSKIERGDRRAKRSQVTKLAEYFHLEEKEGLSRARFAHSFKFILQDLLDFGALKPYKQQDDRVIQNRTSLSPCS